MKVSIRFSRMLCAAGVVLGLCLAGPARAQEKVKGEPDKGGAKVIVIQLDASKVPPDLIEKLMALSKAGDAKKPAPTKGDDSEKKTTLKKGDDAEKKPAPKKGEGDLKKGEVQKPNIVQVDLNKLSPDLAKRLMDELYKAKSAGNPFDKKNEDDKAKKNPGKTNPGSKDDDGKKKATKNDDDDDDNGKKAGKKNDDDDNQKGGKKSDKDDDDDDKAKKNGKKQDKDDDDDDKGGKKKGK